MQDNPPRPSRYDAPATFGALLLALYPAGAVAQSFGGPRQWIGTCLFVLLAVGYGRWTRPGRDTAFGYYVAAAFLVPFAYVLLFLAPLFLLPEAAALKLMDFTGYGFNVGLFLSGGADAPLDIISVVWMLSMIPVVLVAAGARQWLLIARADRD